MVDGLTPEQEVELQERLTEDILMRYDNEEYWDENIISEYLDSIGHCEHEYEEGVCINCDEELEDDRT